MADPANKTTDLDDFIEAFDSDWIKAGQPSAQATIAMVHEIKILRHLLWMIQDQGYHPSGYLKDMIEAAVQYD